jgi:hypothetical protein
MLVACALAKYMNNRLPASCFPGIDTIALQAKLGERCVRYALRDLEVRGLIVRFGGVGRGNRAYYEWVEKGHPSRLASRFRRTKRGMTVPLL